MNIALMAHTNKEELMTQFCTAYAGVLSRHTLCATSITGRAVAEATGLPIHLFLARVHGGIEQIGARLAYDELDLVLFLNDPNDHDPRRAEEVSYISSLCDKHNVPFASNVATAEMLVLGLDRGDLDWREVLYPRNLPFTS